MKMLGQIVSQIYARSSKVAVRRLLLSGIFIVFTICPYVYSEPVVKWWIASMKDMKNELSPQTDAVIAPIRGASRPAIIIDANKTYQTIVGLGSSFDHSTCYNISLLSEAQQEKVLE